MVFWTGCGFGEPDLQTQEFAVRRNFEGPLQSIPSNLNVVTHLTLVEGFINLVEGRTLEL